MTIVVHADERNAAARLSSTVTPWMDANIVECALQCFILPAMLRCYITCHYCGRFITWQNEEERKAKEAKERLEEERRRQQEKEEKEQRKR